MTSDGLAGAGRPHALRPLDWGLGAALLLAFAPAIGTLARVWSSLDYYSHGFLVPLAAVWAAYQSGAAHERRPLVRAREGLALVVGAVAIYGVGLGVGSATLQGLAVVAAVAGYVAYLWGVASLRAFAFPLGFLLFMVPIPPSVLTPAIVQLQLAVSGASVGLLHAVGFTIAREGNVMLLPGGGSLFVDEACSGITSIVTLLPLGVVLAYFSARATWRRVAIVAAVVPIAMVGNLARVVATVVAADAYGVEQVTRNALHDSAGLATFVLACLALIGVSAALRPRGAE